MSTNNNRNHSARRWSEEEDQILINKIGENPLNLRMCFIAASVSLRRSPAACSTRWYNHLQKSERKEHTAILTMGKHIAIRNRRRFKPDLPKYELRAGIFSRIVDYLFSETEQQ